VDTEDLIAKALELLKLPPYFNVATSHDDEPWSSPVWAARDVGFNFYWSSWVKAVHSQNIERNPRAFLTLFDSTRPRGTNNFRCLYLQCEVAVVTDQQEAGNAFRLLYPDDAVSTADFLDPGQKRFYRAMPRRVWLNCLSERQLTSSTMKMRVELPLDELRAGLLR